jgi:hypothetical protein
MEINPGALNKQKFREIKSIWTMREGGLVSVGLINIEYNQYLY